MTSYHLDDHPIHLGLGAAAVAQPTFTGMQWYADYETRHAADGAEGRLVSQHTFDTPWDVWEMHPLGSEVVLCLAGAMTLIQEVAGEEQVRIDLQAGSYAINPAGVWHTADTHEGATALFITAGKETQHRAR